MSGAWGTAAQVSRKTWILAGITSTAMAAVITAAVLPPLPLLLTCAALLYVGLALASLARPMFFLTIFLISLVVLPPFFFGRFGETPIYAPSALIPIALAVLVARLPDFHFRFDPIAKGLACFLVATAISLPFGWWLSGSEAGLQGFMRWLLLAQSALIFVLVRGGARREPDHHENRLIPVLMVSATLTGAYGIFDFLWPVPLPHPAADQYIWLAGEIMRRAQGVFYESSNFANLCVFFLAAMSAAYLTRQEQILKLPRLLLLFSITVLWTGSIVAFSRSAWANLLVTLLVFALVSRQVRPWRALTFVSVLALPLAAFSVYSPELWDYLLMNRIGSIIQVFDDPNMVSSWRIGTWTRIGSILQDNPHYFIFGVGYKSLPHSRLFHDQIVTDNGYLNLLLETGIVGLSGFLLFTGRVFKTFWQISRRAAGRTAFWSLFLFSFWAGECVQLLFADAYTYWRNFVVFLALMGLVMNWSERENQNLRGTTAGVGAS
jgi:hypothetical protein